MLATGPVASLEPPEIPPALRARRAAALGRCISLRGNGSITLTSFDEGQQTATFDDARTAERALLLGITWRPVAKKAG